MTVKIVSINHDGPVRVRELGRSGNGYDGIFPPSRFQAAADMINRSGGPVSWRITPAAEGAR